MRSYRKEEKSMYKNPGIELEENLVRALSHRYEELSNNMKTLVKHLFGYVEPDSEVQATIIEGFMKPDIEIKIDDESHYVSIKSGKSDIVGQEYIKDFCKYLESYGISQTTIETILLYQYGDGTTDGTGEKRFDYDELRYRLSTRIKEANEELNSNKDFVLSVIRRATFKGNKEDNIEADAIYHGNEDYGDVASIAQVMKHCNRRDWHYIKNLHIGPLHLRPHARYVDKEIKNPMNRERLEFVWVGLGADIRFISTRYDG